MQAIRAESDGASLVLLDEVGTGTDPVEGSALGLALLRALVRGGFGGAGFVVATTHHRCVGLLLVLLAKLLYACLQHVCRLHASINMSTYETS